MDRCFAAPLSRRAALVLGARLPQTSQGPSLPRAGSPSLRSACSYPSRRVGQPTWRCAHCAIWPRSVSVGRWSSSTGSEPAVSSVRRSWLPARRRRLHAGADADHGVARAADRRARSLQSGRGLHLDHRAHRLPVRGGGARGRAVAELPRFARRCESAPGQDRLRHTGRGDYAPRCHGADRRSGWHRLGSGALPRRQQNLETLLAGRINAAADASGWAPQVQEGRLRLSCTWGAARARRFRMRDAREVGFDMVATSPYGIAGPKGMAAGVVQVLHDSFKDALNDPAHVAVLDRFDMQIAYLDSEDYATAIRRQYEEEREMVRHSACGQAERPRGR